MIVHALQLDLGVINTYIKKENKFIRCIEGVGMEVPPNLVVTMIKEHWLEVCVLGVG